MATFKHRQLVDSIAQLDTMPRDTNAYAEWITARGHLDLLRCNALADELIIFAVGDYSFAHTVVVREDALNPLNVNDLLAWSGGPYSAVAGYCWGGGRDDVWIDRSGAIYGSKSLRESRPLLFARDVPVSADEDRVYYEVSQEYAHITNIHLMQEYGAYCRFDRHGDLEHAVSLSIKRTDKNVSLITFKRDLLEEYLAATASVLVRMFDFTLLDRSAFTSWPDKPEEIIRERDLFFRQRVDENRAAYTRGVQIIFPRKTRTELFSSIKGIPVSDGSPQYVEYIAWDWRNKRIVSISTDPRETTNYFRADGNSLPFELSPAFFRPDVLLKYKSDTGKYVVDERDIRCRSAWELRGIDVNKAGQVHAYICDLRKLPYEEQLYWKSFNEQPKS